MGFVVLKLANTESDVVYVNPSYISEVYHSEDADFVCVTMNGGSRWYVKGDIEYVMGDIRLASHS